MRRDRGADDGERRGRARRDHFALVLGDGRQDVDRQARRMRVVAGDEIDARLHQRRNELDVAREAVELGDDQGRMAQPARGDLWPVAFLAAFDLLEFGDDDALGAADMARNRLAVRFQPQPRGALLGGRHPVVGKQSGAAPARPARAARPGGAF
jgi:hypothetical protein